MQEGIQRIEAQASDMINGNIFKTADDERMLDDDAHIPAKNAHSSDAVKRIKLK
jgi:hypothetical protein